MNADQDNNSTRASPDPMVLKHYTFWTAYYTLGFTYILNP